MKTKKQDTKHKIFFSRKAYLEEIEEAQNILGAARDMHRQLEKVIMILGRNLNFMTEDARDLRRIRRSLGPETQRRKSAPPSPEPEKIPGKAALLQRSAVRLSRPVGED